MVINHRNWKRLDRTLVSDFWLEIMPETTNTHLADTDSYHCPFLMKMVSNKAEHIKYFGFRNRWVVRPLFPETVKTCWIRKVTTCGHFTTN